MSGSGSGSGSADADGSGSAAATGAIDARAEMLSGAKSIAVAPPPSRARGVTSDLSIDEALLLHGAGWEPVDLVCGVSVVSVPVGVWNWGQGEITVASVAHNAAVKAAADQLRDECIKVHGHGVVGVRVEVEVRTHHIDVELVGTAVRPMESKNLPPGVPVRVRSFSPRLHPAQGCWLDARGAGVRCQLCLCAPTISRRRDEAKDAEH